jgi:HD domain
MERVGLESLKEWFAVYCRRFYTGSTKDDRNYALKEEHTSRVCSNMKHLTGRLGLAENVRTTAEVIALFHDVGRFEQYRRHQTFRDADSENHATLGVRVLTTGRVLDTLADEERRTIFRAVALHNVFRLPDTLAGRDLLFTRLIRDADKLDIWRVFIDYYGLPEEERASAVGLGFPDLPGCSPAVLESLHRREMVNLATVKSLNDFKLLQLSWAFDLNFTHSFQLVLERNAIGLMSGTLPADPEVGRGLQVVRDFVESKAQG